MRSQKTFQVRRLSLRSRLRGHRLVAVATASIAAAATLAVGVAAAATTGGSASPPVKGPQPSSIVQLPSTPTAPAPPVVADPNVCGTWSAATSGTGIALARAHGSLRNCMKFGSDWVLATINDAGRPGAIGVLHCAGNAACVDGRNDPGANAFSWYTPALGAASAVVILGEQGSSLIVDYDGHQLLFDPATGSFTEDNGGNR